MGKLLSMLQCLVYIHPFFFNCSSLCSHDVLYHTWKHLLVARNCLLFLSLCPTWFRQGRLWVPPEKEGYCGQELKPGSEDCWKGCQAPETHYPVLLHFSTSMQSLPSTKCSFVSCWGWWHMILFLPKCISENVEKCGQSAVTRSWNQKFPDPSGSSYHGAQLEWLISWLCISVNYSAAKYYQLHTLSTNIFYLVSLSSDLFVFASPLFKLCIYSCMKPFVIKVLQLHVC